MGFSAAANLSSLDFDFTTASQEDGTPCTGKGVIPEPSSQRIVAFFNSVGSLSDIQSADVAAIDKLIQLLADVCSGTPSVDDLKTLPFRALIAFSRWFMEELSPKG